MAYLSENPDMLIAQVARENDVREGTLQKQRAEGNSKTSRLGAGKALSDEMEDALENRKHRNIIVSAPLGIEANTN